MNIAAHLVGIASLALIYWIGAWTWGQSPRIVAALRREPIPPVAVRRRVRRGRARVALAVRFPRAPATARKPEASA